MSFTAAHIIRAIIDLSSARSSTNTFLFVFVLIACIHGSGAIFFRQSEANWQKPVATIAKLLG